MAAPKSTVKHTQPAANAEDIPSQIQNLAYQLWLERGAPLGSPDVDWLEAEARVNNKAVQRH